MVGGHGGSGSGEGGQDGDGNSGSGRGGSGSREEDKDESDEEETVSPTPSVGDISLVIKRTDNLLKYKVKIGDSTTVREFKYLAQGATGIPVAEQILSLDRINHTGNDVMFLDFLPMSDFVGDAYLIENTAPTVLIAVRGSGGAATLKTTRKDMMLKKASALKGEKDDVDMTEQLMLDAVNAASSVLASKAIDFGTIADAMGLADIEKFTEFCNHSKIHNHKKLQELHSYTVQGSSIMKGLSYFSQAAEKVQELTSNAIIVHFTTASGDLRIGDVLAELAVQARMKKKAPGGGSSASGDAMGVGGGIVAMRD